GRSGTATDVMSVSGRIDADHVGRAALTFYPTVEPKNEIINTTFSTVPDTVAPTARAYDVLDRVTLTTFPDATTLSQARTMGTDRSGMLRQLTTTTDALSNRKIAYADVRQNLVALQEFNPTKGEVIWTTYSYDPLQQLVGIVDDHANHTSVGYDLLGR